MEAVYWTMKDGKRIDIDHMDILHLRNTLKMIVRNSNKVSTFQLNGDIAQHSIEEQIEEDYLDYYDKQQGGNY
jgi:predicted oxidoreductase